MAVATATAFSGQVRTQRRAWTTSRGCWRLVVLLGLAWVALLMLGGTAHAAPSPERRDEATPAAPGPIPLLGQALANVGATAGALPLEHVVHTLTGSRTAVPQPVAEAVEKSTKTLATATGTAATTASAVASTAPAHLPVVDGVDAVAGLADAVRSTADATASPEKLLDVKVPSVTATVMPVVDAVADQVDATAQLVADAVLTSPLPVARPLQAAVTPLASTIGLATDVVSAAGSFAAGAVDGVVATTTHALAPVLAAVSAPIGSIAVAGASSGSGAGSATGAGSQSTPGIIPADTVAPQASSASALSPADERIPPGADGSPAVPPPDASSTLIDIVAQPASDTTTVLPVPVSGAGSTTGNGGAAPSPVLDQTLVRVESEPEFADDTTDPIDGPTGPMPGTPAADPAFSPD